MKFRTEIDVTPSAFPIQYDERILTIGSCFSENIGSLLAENNFQVLVNPFGVLYNPVSVLNSLKIIADKKEFNAKDLIFRQGEWHSLFHHSDFSHHNMETCLKNINESIKSSNEFLNKCDRIIITYGTSYVFNFIPQNIIVSNCHKIPQAEFKRSRLTLESVSNYVEQTVTLLKSINPSIKIIFTVSPVRHWKDGAVDNQVSKAQLLLAIDAVVKNESNCEYFPSYELVMDDLRDYRFYDEDLIHPNKIAVKYIWDKLKSSYFSDSTLEAMQELEKIISAKNHRLRNTESDETKKFAAKNIELVKSFSARYKTANLSEELNYFKKLLQDN